MLYILNFYNQNLGRFFSIVSTWTLITYIGIILFDLHYIGFRIVLFGIVWGDKVWKILNYLHS